jgi:Ca2+-binding RTX toxin-like protein
LFGSSQQSSKQPKKSRLRGEALEPRNLCAVDVSLDGNVIVIEGSDAADKVVVTHQVGDKNNPYDDKVVVTWTSGGVTQSKSFDMYKYVQQGDMVKAVKNVDYLEFSGGAGNDKFWNQTSLVSYLNGGEGNDELHGGSDYDQIEGGKGSDKIWGNDGHDYLYANEKDDAGYESSLEIIHGGDGDDRIFGTNGASNFLFGDADDDVLVGGNVSGLNVINGGTGDDELDGGNGVGNGQSVVNQLTDTSGADWFRGGNKAFNVFYAVDGYKGKSGDDTILVGHGSFDIWITDGRQIVNNQWIGDSVPGYPNG